MNKEKILKEVSFKLANIVNKISAIEINQFDENLDFSFEKDLFFDSLQFIQLVTDIEAEFGISLDDELVFEILDDYKNLKMCIYNKISNIK